MLRQITNISLLGNQSGTQGENQGEVGAIARGLEMTLEDGQDWNGDGWNDIQVTLNLTPGNSAELGTQDGTQEYPFQEITSIAFRLANGKLAGLQIIEPSPLAESNLNEPWLPPQDYEVWIPLSQPGVEDGGVQAFSMVFSLPSDGEQMGQDLDALTLLQDSRWLVQTYGTQSEWIAVETHSFQLDLLDSSESENSLDADRIDLDPETEPTDSVLNPEPNLESMLDPVTNFSDPNSNLNSNIAENETLVGGSALTLGPEDQVEITITPNLDGTIPFPQPTLSFTELPGWQIFQNIWTTVASSQPEINQFTIIDHIDGGIRSVGYYGISNRSGEVFIGGNTLRGVFTETSQDDSGSFSYSLSVSSTFR